MEIVLLLVRSRMPAINEELVRLDFFATVFELFQAFEFNNLLHQVVEKLVQSSLQQPSLAKHLLEDKKLLRFLGDCVRVQNSGFSSPRHQFRKANLAHLTQIAMALFAFFMSDAGQDYHILLFSNNKSH